MKQMLGLIVSLLSLLAFASTAQSGGGEASGTFTFDLGTATGTTDFFGQLKKDETVNGQISFNATVDASDETCQQVPVQSGDNIILVDVCEPNGNTQPTTVGLNFLIDCMVIADNRAAMSGTIADESSPFRGLHTILAVENASGNDGFTWGVYKTKTVNTNAKDYDFCPNYTPPGDCGEFDCPPPPTGCINGQDPENPSNTGDTGATLSWTATDYELCPYPPPSDTENFVPPDPHNYVCFGGQAPDPNGYPTGIPVLAQQTITHCGSFPLFTYPMTPVPHGDGNKVSVKNNS